MFQKHGLNVGPANGIQGSQEKAVKNTGVRKERGGSEGQVALLAFHFILKVRAGEAKPLCHKSKIGTRVRRKDMP